MTLIALDVGVLAWATLIEKWYGAAAAHFGIYDTGWFFGLNAALAVNVLAAMVIRFPWRRRQAGFVVTHAGILVLLAGCLLTRLGGVEAQLPVFEGHSVHRAYLDSSHFEIRVSPTAAESGTGPFFGEKTLSANKPLTENMDLSPSASTSTTSPICIPFIAGPFSWSNYAQLSWFPWSLARRSQGKLYDRDGIVLELLDYVDKPLPQVQARLTIDGKAETFALVSSEDLPQGNQQHEVKSDRRSASITLRPDVIDLGFQVHLSQFRRKLDPGSGTASHYSSLVDFLDRSDPPRTLQENVLITLNAPIDFAEPKTGRSWRFFQAGFAEPRRPGSAEFDQLAGKDRSRDQIYLSRLSINDDPGRGLKYLGSLMIVVGIVAVYLRNRRKTSMGSLR